MARVPHRRFTLLDAMILIVAVAVGLALGRSTLHELNPSPVPLPTPAFSTSTTTPHSPPFLIELRRVVSWLVAASTELYPSVATLTVATLLLRLRSPRPRLRLAFRQPGAAACVAAALALSIAVLTYAPTTILALSKPNYQGWMFNVWLFASRGAGMAVAAAWLTLKLGGLWRRERSWVDLMGRLLGVSWMAAVVLEVASYWLSPFY